MTSINRSKIANPPSVLVTTVNCIECSYYKIVMIKIEIRINIIVFNGKKWWWDFKHYGFLQFFLHLEDVLEYCRG